MIKKVIDILPPKKVEKKKKVFEFVEEKKLEIPKKEFKPFKEKLPKFSIKKGLILSAILILALIFILLSFKFSKAEIKIWPKTEDLKLNEKLVVDTKAGSIDLKNKIIPGKLFEFEETFSDDFSASGEVLKKSEGTIRLFNEYTTQDEVWKEGTRFVSSDGKLFKSKDKIFVPGAKIKEGKIEASFVDVPVIADKGGEEYNIGPSDFSILAFKGTPRYFKYYGKSFQPMKGGGKGYQVTKEDLEKAEKNLIEKGKEKAKEILKEKIGADFSFPEDAISIEVLDKISSAKEGEELEKFNFKVKLKIKTIAFPKSDLLSFVKDYVLSQVPSNKEISFENLKFNYKTEVANFDLGKITLSLDISAKIYSTIDPLYLKKGLAGKKIKEAKAYLFNQPEFSKVQIKIFPFWINKIPDNINQVEIFYPIID
jgi:hypothetical protein